MIYTMKIRTNNLIRISPLITMIMILYCHLSLAQTKINDLGFSVRKNLAFVGVESGNYTNLIEKLSPPASIKSINAANIIPLGNYYVKSFDISALKERKIPNLYIKELYFDGDRFTYEKILKLAQMNMSDSDAKMFNVTALGQKGSASRKYYEKILGSNWIVAYKFDDIHTMEEEYDRIDARNRERAANEANNPKIPPKNKYKFVPVDRTHKGYVAKLILKLYKIQLDTPERLFAFENTVFKDGTENPQAILQRIMNYNFPVEYKTSNDFIIRSAKPKSSSYGKPQLLQALFDPHTVESKTYELLKDTKDFRIKTTIYKIGANKDILIKVGTKEGVATDSRFIVYEVVLDKKGKKKLKKKGAVRLIGKAINNKGVATGSTRPSHFVQYQGGKLDKGMFVVEKPYSILIGFSGLNGFGFKIGMHFPQLLSLFKSGLSANYYNSGGGSFFNGLKVVGFADIYNNDYNSDRVHTALFGLGLEKEMVIAPNFVFDLTTAYGLGSVDWQNSDSSNNSDSSYDNEYSSSSDEDKSNSFQALILKPALGLYISPSTKISLGYQLRIKTTSMDDTDFPGYKAPSSLRLGIQIDL